MRTYFLDKRAHACYIHVMVIANSASAVSSRDAITGHAGTSSPEDVGHAQRTTRQKESAIMERLNAYCPSFQTPYPSPCPLSHEECEAQHDHGDHTAEQAAQRIAEHLGLTVVAAFKGDRCPKWGANDASRSRSGCACGQIHGDRYRVTLKWTLPRPGRAVGDYMCATHDGKRWQERPASLSFDFWASQHDQETGKRPSYYDILSCVSSDAGGPTDAAEVVEEYGEMKPSQAIAVAKHAAKLQAFFTEAELTALGEIR